MIRFYASSSLVLQLMMLFRGIRSFSFFFLGYHGRNWKTQSKLFGVFIILLLPFPPFIRQQMLENVWLDGFCLWQRFQLYLFLSESYVLYSGELLECPFVLYSDILLFSYSGICLTFFKKMSKKPSSGLNKILFKALWHDKTLG